ncbi:hypothetical protein Ancab_008499 [Ancistrocladus abbreviatus]
MKLHIVMFPWLAFGHMIPFLELSKFLAQRGHHISFVSTPRNIQRLPKLPQSLASLFEFVKLPLPCIDDLPVVAEATSDVPYDKVQYLKKAYDGLLEPMARFLETSSPDWIVYDFASHWLSPVATNLGIKQAFFSIFNARIAAFVSGPLDSNGTNSTWSKPENLTVPPKWITFSTNIAFRLHEAKKLSMYLAETNASGVTDLFRIACAIKGCDVMALRTCNELEADFLHLLEEIHGKPMPPLGLMPSSANDDDKSNNDDTWKFISGWLGKHDKGSVVYIAFGSEGTQSPEELAEVALGLERSELPFFWVLKRVALEEELVVPDGFEERTKDRGLVWRSWAPQLKILNHRSIGGFLTHCGWSSLLEGLQFGQPLIMLPFFSDQGLIARAMKERKVGVEIPRDEETGAFTGDSVAKCLRLVVVEEDGKIYREKAKEESEMFGNKSLHEKYLENFEDHLIKNI